MSSDFEGIYSRDYSLHLRLIHYRAHREAQFTIVYIFSHRERYCVQLLIALLLVRRNRVVDYGLYAIVCQMLLQLITILAQYREQVEYMGITFRVCRQLD